MDKIRKPWCGAVVLLRRPPMAGGGAETRGPAGSSVCHAAPSHHSPSPDATGKPDRHSTNSVCILDCLWALGAAITKELILTEHSLCAEHCENLYPLHFSLTLGQGHRHCAPTTSLGKLSLGVKRHLARCYTRTRAKVGLNQVCPNQRSSFQPLCS